jgi:hypothetical protein
MTPRRNLVLAIAVAILGYVGMLWFDPPVTAPWPPGTIWAPGPGVAPTPRPSADRDGQEALLAAIRAQTRYEDFLFGFAEVVGTGVGWTTGGTMALKVFVEPGGTPSLPATLDGFPLVIKEAGPFYALGTVPPGFFQESAAPAMAQESGQESAVAQESYGTGLRAAGRPADASVRLPTSRFERPVPMGVSTGHTGSTAGTIGAVVTDGALRYALSNWHVYVPAGVGKVGDSLLQPGPYDGGAAPADVIGTLAAFEPVVLSMFANNRIDAALALTDQVAPHTPPDGYGSPRSETMEARPGLEVKKYGRTTGFTFGTVDAINASINVNYGSSGKVGRFVGQIMICCSVSAGGDSGSLIVAHDVDRNGDPGPNDRRPVALLFAGDATNTIANPIDLVLDRFGVTIVGDEER